MMIVLQMIVIITTIAIASFKPMIHELQNERFIHQLIEDIYYAQQLSLAGNDITQVLFLPSSHKYNIIHSTKLVYSRSYEQNIEIMNNTLRLNELRFLANGNAYKSGSIAIYIDGKLHFLRVLLGKGRFYVEKI